MKKIVINTDFGGFGLSHKAYLRYAELAGFSLKAFEEDFSKNDKELREWNGQGKEPLFVIYYKQLPDGLQEFFYSRDLKRDDPLLVQVVEELKEEANGRSASLAVVEIPDDVDWQIEEYDGSEWISEKHRTWR